MEPSTLSSTKTALSWTGERLIDDPAVGADVIVEHLQRYAFALAFAKGRRVLDVACGEGYGSSLLASVATEVMGMDADETAIRHASRKYVRSNLRFGHAVCPHLPRPDQSVDLLVSFETLEHFVEHEVFMAEVKRVLAPGGLLLISTPDKKNYSEASGYQNPFHLRELNREEFARLLASGFDHVRLFRQSSIFGALLMAEDGQPPRKMTVTHGNLHNIKSTAAFDRGHYLVAMASDQTLPEFDADIFDDPKLLSGLLNDHNHLQVVLARVQELEQESAQERGRWASERAGFEQQLAGERLRHHEELAVVRDKVERMKGSISWRFTAPLRALRRALQLPS